MNTGSHIHNKLCETLKLYRKLKNFSQEGLSEASGISVRTIQRMETGESIGSAYTLQKLATALGIEVSQFNPQPNLEGSESSAAEERLNLLNLSALAVVLLPLSNLIFPYLILSRNNGDGWLRQNAKKIFSFQIIWSLITLLLIVVVPLLLLSFKPFRGGSVPLSVPVYYLSVVANVCYTLSFSIAINKHRQFLTRLPNIL
jgi:XRE family transcriptional regulator, regulator of sulfur utilization